MNQCATCPEPFLRLRDDVRSSASFMYDRVFVIGAFAIVLLEEILVAWEAILEAIVGRPGLSWRIWRPFWLVLEASWAVPEAILGYLGGHLSRKS